MVNTLSHKKSQLLKWNRSDLESLYQDQRPNIAGLSSFMNLTTFQNYIQSSRTLLIWGGGLHYGLNTEITKRYLKTLSAIQSQTTHFIYQAVHAPGSNKPEYYRVSQGPSAVKAYNNRIREYISKEIVKNRPAIIEWYGVTEGALSWVALFCLSKDESGCAKWYLGRHSLSKSSE